MKTFSIRKKQCVIWMVLPLFLFSIFSIATPLEASLLERYPVPRGHVLEHVPVVPGTVTMNPPATEAESFYIPPDAVRVGVRIEGRVSQVYLDPINTERIYMLRETSQDRILTFRYIYNNLLGTVTLLTSFVKKGEEPRFAHYYRYAQGAQSSLELILDEGWVKEGGVLIPSRIYDYFRGVVNVRTLDRAGNILKLESSAGVTRHFIYSRGGRLLTIEDTSSSGELSFYDQPVNVRDWDFPPMNTSEDRQLFVLPDRGKEKLFTPTGRSLEIGGLTDPRLREDGYQMAPHHFLLWLESAHPLRAGPAGGLL